MSKKMMKRSLALGALMAFVITGSAMAAELTIADEAAYSKLKNDSTWYHEHQIIYPAGTTHYVYTNDSFTNNTITIGSVDGTGPDMGTERIYGSRDKTYGNATGNTVNINGGTFGIVYGGYADIADAATNASYNTININEKANLTLTEQVYVGIAHTRGHNASADNNALNIKGNVTNDGFKGLSVAHVSHTNKGADDGDVTLTTNNNAINISGEANVKLNYGSMYVAFNSSSPMHINHAKTEANYNVINVGDNAKVKVNIITVANSGGGYEAEANNNSAIISGNAVVDGAVYVSDAHANVANYKPEEGGKATANNNIVTVKDNAKVTKWVQAGYTYSLIGNRASGITEANDNVVNVKDNASVASLFGARAKGYALNDTITAKNNIVNIGDKATVEVVVPEDDDYDVYGVYGAYVHSEVAVNENKDMSATATAEDNAVNITGGTVNSNVYGAYAVVETEDNGAVLTTNVNNNAVNISGGTVNGDVYGGYSEVISVESKYIDKIEINGWRDMPVTNVGPASNNEVNISGTANVENANLYGNNGGEGTGNALNIGDGWSGKIKSAQNFNTVNFGKGSSVTTNVTLSTGATINLADGDDYTGNNYAINGKLTTLEGDKAILTIGNIKANTYNIASNYQGTKDWTLESELMDVESWNTTGQLQVTTKAKPGNEIAEQLGVSENTGNFVEDIISGGNNEATDFLNKLMDTNVTDEVRNDTLAAVQKMGEAGGNSATAANIVKNVTGVTNDRLSFNCGHSAPHKGGHGVGLFEEGSGADIWVEYVHGKDEVEDMPSTAGASSYEGQYNGLVMGVDFKKVGKFQSGIAFNYGEGDTNSVGSLTRTHSDYDFWGVGYYGNIHNDDSNIIFDINYAQTESDVTQSSGASTLEASPETTTWSAGVKLEKLYQNENVQIVPYTGLRYISIDTDDYATKGGGFMYNMERQNIWMLPLGVSIRQEIENDNGWTVSPRVDLSYIWAFGDTNSNMEVKVGNGITPIGYDVMDDGSFLGLVGIEAHKGQWGYGIAYSYQKGDHSESKKWYGDVNYSF